MAKFHITRLCQAIGSLLLHPAMKSMQSLDADISRGVNHESGFPNPATDFGPSILPRPIPLPDQPHQDSATIQRLMIMVNMSTSLSSALSERIGSQLQLEFACTMLRRVAAVAAPCAIGAATDPSGDVMRKFLSAEGSFGPLLVWEACAPSLQVEGRLRLRSEFPINPSEDKALSL